MNESSPRSPISVARSGGGGVLVTTTPVVLVVLFVTPWWYNGGHWYMAAVAVVMVILLHACGRWQQQQQQQEARLDDTERWNVRFHGMEPVGIVQTLAQVETVRNKDNNDDTEQQQQLQQQQAVAMLSTGLGTLAKKFNALVRNKRSRNTTTQGKKQTAAVSATTTTTTMKSNPHVDALALLCQEAAYIGCRYVLDHPSSSHDNNNDDNNDSSSNNNNSETQQGANATMMVMNASAAATALLALIAKNDAVRERHLYQAHVYGLPVPIQVIRQALEHGKDIQDDEAAEQMAAQVQRKACLWLGALSEGNATIAQLVADEQGLTVIVNAAQWYRHHSHVANWALWALFILLYEYPPNKAVFVDADAVPLVIELLRNHCTMGSSSSSSSRKSGGVLSEVARHGVALLFDLLRENSPASVNVCKIRQAALTAGMHPVLVQVMRENSDAMDILMMGSEILLGTGYEGEIPTFEPSLTRNVTTDHR